MSAKNPRKKKRPFLETKVVEHRKREYIALMFPDSSGTWTIKEKGAIDTITVGGLYVNPKNTGLFDEEFLKKIRNKHEQGNLI